MTGQVDLEWSLHAALRGGIAGVALVAHAHVLELLAVDLDLALDIGKVEAEHAARLGIAVGVGGGERRGWAGSRILLDLRWGCIFSH